MSDAMDPILRQVIEAVGGTAALAQLLGIQAPSIYSWSRVPPNRVRAVAAATGIPPHVLRPDLWDAPTEPKAKSKRHASTKDASPSKPKATAADTTTESVGKAA